MNQTERRRFSLVREVLLIALGIASAGFGLEGFLLPNAFIDGGVTGISLLTAELTGLPLAALIVVLNLPFLALGYSQIGPGFAFKSIAAIGGLALAITFVHYPVVTSDKLLIAVFGGFFVGAGIGLSIRGGAVLDGTEVLAIYLSKRTGLTIGDIILLFNIVIFGVAAYLLSVETALYSILAYLSASKAVDFLIEGIEEYLGVTVISELSEAIRQMITEKMRRGVTLYVGRRGYAPGHETPAPIDIVYTVVTRLEIARLQSEILDIDSEAFIVVGSVKDTKGGLIKKRPLKS